MFLQEFNQLFQICNVLWFHSFLDFPPCGLDGWFIIPARRPCSTFSRPSEFDQGLGRRGQHLASASGYSHHVLNANAELARQINPRLDGNHHPGQQPGCLSGADAWRLVNLQANDRGRWSGKMPLPILPCATRRALPRPLPRSLCPQPPLLLRPPGPPTPPHTPCARRPLACPDTRFGSYPSNNH